MAGVPAGDFSTYRYTYVEKPGQPEAAFRWVKLLQNRLYGEAVKLMGFAAI
jgi:hypothetical protein